MSTPMKVKFYKFETYGTSSVNGLIYSKLDLVADPEAQFLGPENKKFNFMRYHGVDLLS